MKNFIYICTFIISITAVAQTSNSVALEKSKLKQSLAYGDKTVAASTMYNIIALEGEQSVYKDSLAYLYFNSRNFVSCFLVAEDVLKHRPDNIALLEMKAVSLESVGAVDKAAEGYQLLFEKTKNNYHAYKLAGLYFTMKKNNEALTIVRQADQLPDDGSMNVTFQVNQNYNQNVPLKAAIAYLEGIVLLELENEKDAKVSFEKAVTAFPDFVLAKSKLTTLEPKEE